MLPPDSPDIYEDYVLSARISPMLSAKHHEYKEDEDNMLFTLRKEIPICSEFVFGSPREQLRNEESWKFKEKDIYDNHWRYCTSNGMTPLEKKDWRFCKLFHEIHDSLNKDWNKTLCIGGLWVDIFLKQRRFISLRGETHEHSVYTLGH